jgi:lambda family phage holin
MKTVIIYASGSSLNLSDCVFFFGSRLQVLAFNSGKQSIPFPAYFGSQVNIECHFGHKSVASCALGISALIDIRAGKPKLYTATGVLICGIFALAVSALLEYLGLPANSGAFVGALVGFVGADRLRDMALATVARRTGIGSTEENK